MIKKSSRIHLISSFILVCLVIAGCVNDSPANTQAGPKIEPVQVVLDPVIEQKIDALMAKMSLEEKIGQMTQVEKGSIKPGHIQKYFIGSILSGGGASPDENSVVGWTKMIERFQQEALSTRLEIPLIYGMDATHGHTLLYGATIFPQQIGLGATRNTELVYQIGQATAEEMLATGVTWTFSPIVAVPTGYPLGKDL